MNAGLDRATALAHADRALPASPTLEEAAEQHYGCLAIQTFDHGVINLTGVHYLEFLKAQTLIKEFKGGKELLFILAMLELQNHCTCIWSIAAELGQKAKIQSLLFNTLGQALCTPPLPGQEEVFLLCPWDFSFSTGALYIKDSSWCKWFINKHEKS